MITFGRTKVKWDSYKNSGAINNATHGYWSQEPRYLTKNLWVSVTFALLSGCSLVLLLYPTFSWSLSKLLPPKTKKLNSLTKKQKRNL